MHKIVKISPFCFLCISDTVRKKILKSINAVNELRNKMNTIQSQMSFDNMDVYQSFQDCWVTLFNFFFPPFGIQKAIFTCQRICNPLVSNQKGFMGALGKRDLNLPFSGCCTVPAVEYAQWITPTGRYLVCFMVLPLAQRHFLLKLNEIYIKAYAHLYLLFFQGQCSFTCPLHVWLNIN